MDKGVSEYRKQPVQSPKESRTAGMEWVGEGGREKGVSDNRR